MSQSALSFVEVHRYCFPHPHRQLPRQAIIHTGASCQSYTHVPEPHGLALYLVGICVVFLVDHLFEKNRDNDIDKDRVANNNVCDEVQTRSDGREVKQRSGYLRPPIIRYDLGTGGNEQNQVSKQMVNPNAYGRAGTST